MIDERSAEICHQSDHFPSTSLIHIIYYRKALRNFASNPPHYLGANREWLMNDLKRAIDLIKGQKDFVDQQIALIDAFKAQATAALMMHDPSNKAGGGCKAKGKDSGGGRAAGGS